MKPVLADAVIAEAEPADPRVNVQIVLEAEQGPLVQEAEHRANVDPDQAAMGEALGAIIDDDARRGRASICSGSP